MSMGGVGRHGNAIMTAESPQQADRQGWPCAGESPPDAHPNGDLPRHQRREHAKNAEKEFGENRPPDAKTAAEQASMRASCRSSRSPTAAADRIVKSQYLR